jgi:hypothetical protein
MIKIQNITPVLSMQPGELLPWPSHEKKKKKKGIINLKDNTEGRRKTQHWTCMSVGGCILTNTYIS